MKEITIRIIYRGWESRIMQRGSFPVNAKRFKEVPSHEAARVASEWINQLRKEAHIGELIDVFFNDDNDITDLVKEYDIY